MRSRTRMLVIAGLLVAPLSLAAQDMADPSGHWEGTIKVPDMELAIEIDLARGKTGAFTGTFGQPAQGVKGLPLSAVTVEGRSVRLVLKDGAQVTTFAGALSADGESISGEVSQGAGSLPFSLARKGEARIAPAPKSPPIGKELEGTWDGTLDLGARQMRVVLKMANQPDGTAKGTIVSPDGTGVEIPVAMKQKASSLTIEVPSVGASWVGQVNQEATELAGSWTQQGLVVPLTFRRAAAGK